jgi:hypothetical protein
MLLNRTLVYSKAAGCAERQIATAALPCIRQPQQLPSLWRFVAAPLQQQAVRGGNGSVARSFASEAHDSEQLGLKEAIKAELEYEHDNNEPEAVSSFCLGCLSLPEANLSDEHMPMVLLRQPMYCLLCLESPMYTANSADRAAQSRTTSASEFTVCTLQSSAGGSPFTHA